MEQESKHLKYFKVENFKCFETFEMENIGQFNLIVGDNNVGKTSVLEALLFDENISVFIGALINSFRLKNSLRAIENGKSYFDLQKFYFNKLTKKDNIQFDIIKTGSDIKNNYNFYLKKSYDLNEAEKAKIRNSMDIMLLKQNNITTNKAYTLYRNSNVIEVLSDGFEYYGYQPFIPSGMAFGNDLHKFYSELAENRTNKKRIEEELKLFIPDLLELSLSTSFIPEQTVIAIYFNDNTQLPLSSQGDGAIKLLRILLEISVLKDTKLMIDEIDNGIHYSRLKLFWKTILTSAKENNVQLFMTTHSLECMKYFSEALEELGEEYQADSRLFHLARLKDGRIKSYNYSYQEFSSNLELENEMRR